MPKPITSAALRPTTQKSQEHGARRLKLYSSTRYVVMPQAQPELKKVPLPKYNNVLMPYLTTSRAKYLDKRLFVQLNGSRKVIGVLRGYDVRLHVPIGHHLLARAY